MSTLKHKGHGPQAMTANDLRGGHVVYLNTEFQWSAGFANALISEDADIIERLQEIGQRSEYENRVVDAYLIDIDPETLQPVRYREKFRQHGPSYEPIDQTTQEVRSVSL